MSDIKLSKSLGDIRAALFARIESVQDEYAAKGHLPARLNLNKGVIRGLLELYCWGQWQLYNFLNTVHKQAIPLDSSGQWLDTHAAQVDVTRKAAARAEGAVRFFRGELSGNVRISAGRIVRTKPDGTGAVYRYVTDAPAVLPDGADSVPVPVTAEEYGAGANASAGRICELATPVEGIGGVTNTADWLTAEGANEESDVSLRRRYVLAWKSKAGVTRAAYEAAALSVSGVADVFVADQHPRGEGTVDVVVQGVAGMPTARLLEDVRAALDTAIVINHDLLVRAPAPVSVDVSLTLELLSGDEAGTLAAAENWIRALFSYSDDADVPRFSIGKDVIRDRIASGLVTLPGVKRVIWDSPAADVEASPISLAILESLTVKALWVEEA